MSKWEATPNPSERVLVSIGHARGNKIYSWNVFVTVQTFLHVAKKKKNGRSHTKNLQLWSDMSELTIFAEHSVGIAA